MRKFRTDNLKDVIIMSQSGSGKTSLGEAFLFNAKATTRLGKVLDGNTVLDFEPEEVKRQSSIFSALHNFKWKNTGVIMLDTPGDNNFTSEAILGLKSADNALFVIDAIDSIKPYSENLWKLAAAEGVTRTCFISKMDRERANFDQVLQDITEVFEIKPLPLTLPIGAEDSFAGVVDVLKKKAFLYEKDGSGSSKEAPIPADMQDQLEEVYGKVIEDLAEVDDALMEKYLEGGELSQAELDSALSEGLTKGMFLPVFCGSALLNMGVQPLMDFMASSFISPEKRTIPALKNSKGETKEYKPTEDQPFCGYVFKTMSDPYTGTMSIIRCLSGTLSPDSNVYNARSEIKERIGSLIMLEGKAQKPLELVGPGDIFAVAKLKETKTGDTLLAESIPFTLPSPVFPEPIMNMAVSQDKGRRGEDHARLPEDHGRRPCPQGVPRRADRRVHPVGPGPAPHRDRRGPSQEEVRRRSGSEDPQGALQGDHHRQRRGSGQAQEADRRPRPVRRLLAQDRTPGAWCRL